MRRRRNPYSRRRRRRIFAVTITDPSIMNLSSMKPNSSSVLITEANLPTGIIFKNKPLLTNINCWHKFIVNNAENSSRNNVLRAILDHVHPLDLIPVSFYTDNLGSYFLARNCGPAIQKLCNDNLVVPNPRSSRPYKISIILKFATTGEFKIDVQKNITSVLTKRYDVATKTLNMVQIHEDPELTEFCPMSQPKIMFFLLHLAKNLNPPPEKYLMNDNRIKVLNPLEALSGNMRTAVSLDLRNNLIEDLSILQPLKLFQLTELFLDGNPLCDKYGYEEYKEGIKKHCKNLEKLDGITVKIAGYPSPQKNFICNLDALDIVNQFLERYFMVYDSHNRRMIQELYHKSAMFSLNTHYHNGQFSSATTRLHKYNNISRNLHKLADFSHQSKYLFQGSALITNALCNLPVTEHDPFSFTVDLMYCTTRCAVIGVSGIFREAPESLLDSEKFYGFRRTFTLEIVNGDGVCYIVNEQLHIHNALSFQVVNSFKHAKAVIPSRMRLPQTEKEQQQVVDTLKIITNMNSEWSRKPNVNELVLLLCSCVTTINALPIFPSGNVETSAAIQGNLILSPLSDLSENLNNAVSSAAKAKTISFVPPFPDSGRTMAVQEQRYLETIPIKLDDKYGRLQEFVANFANPKPIVDTIQEHEKYGNDGGKFRSVGTAVVGGYEVLSNVLNAAVELPFTAFRQFGKKVSTSLNTVGGKLVGLSR